MKLNRLESIDFLRGIASIAVVLFHITRAKDFLDSEGIVYNLFKGGGGFGVSVFFVISGFIIPYSMQRADYKVKSFKAFFFKRIIRIEPVYILSIFFTAVMMVGISKMPEIYWDSPPYKLDFTNFVLHLGYIINFLPNESWINPVYWTLGIEFQYYFLIGLLFPLLVKKNKFFNLFFLFLLAGICWFIFLCWIEDSYLHYGKLLIRYFPIFLVGVSLFQLKAKILDKYSFIIFNICMIVLCWTEFKLNVLIAIIFSLIVLFTMKKSPKFFLFLGKISFSMYLIHIPMHALFKRFIFAHIQDDVGRTLLILLTVLPIIGVSWLFYEFIEEPCIRLSKKIRY